MQDNILGKYVVYGASAKGTSLVLSFSELEDLLRKLIEDRKARESLAALEKEDESNTWLVLFIIACSSSLLLVLYLI